MDNSCAPVAGGSSLVELGLGVERVLRRFFFFGPGLGVDFEACAFFFFFDPGLGVDRKTRWFSSGFGVGLGGNGDRGGFSVMESACSSIFCFKLSTKL
jgi:hypothetical protein